jgi:hypothetical protein
MPEKTRFTHDSVVAAGSADGVLVVSGAEDGEAPAPGVALADAEGEYAAPADVVVLQAARAPASAAAATTETAGRHGSTRRTVMSVRPRRLRCAITPRL